MNNHYVVTFESDDKYIYLSATFGGNQFTIKLKLESIEKVARYAIQMLHSAK